MDYGWPSPGFRLGFPTFYGPYVNSTTNRNSFGLITPSGRAVELRQVAGVETYESEDGSYIRFKHDLATGNYILTMPDGTQYIYSTTLDIKDRNGNLITASYNVDGLMDTITDTLGREILFQYDSFYGLLKIQQVWNGITKDLATFDYDSNYQLMYRFTSGLVPDNVTYGQTMPVMYQVTLLDNSRYKFLYNTYGQVNRYEKYGGLNFLRAWTQYNLPTYSDGSTQTGCPGFTTRTDWAYEWSAAGGVATSFQFNQSVANPDAASESANPNLICGQVTTPDGTTYKELYYGLPVTSARWRYGLLKMAETWTDGNTIKRKWTKAQYEQPCGGGSIGNWLAQCNPRVAESNIYDNTDSNNNTWEKQRRTTISYAAGNPTDFNLPADVYEYDYPSVTTVLRRTHTDYNQTSAYVNRRIIGLPTASFLYDGGGALSSKVEYYYDEQGNFGGDSYLQSLPTTPIRHDIGNYGNWQAATNPCTTCVHERGNLTTVRRYDVSNGQYVESKTAYAITGTPLVSSDPLSHKTRVDYTDAFCAISSCPSQTVQNKNSYAYPTKVTDPDGYFSTVSYDFNIGAPAKTFNPKGSPILREYDGYGRLWRVINQVNGAYTRYDFDSNQYFVKSYSTIQEGQGEFYSITIFDGHDRPRATVSEHPGSAGGYKGVYNAYDTMGRQAQVSNPTEINSSWVPAGDDVVNGSNGGWRWSLQSYDWKGRPLVSTNTDGSTRSASYVGCGCAGGDATTLQGEPTATGTPENRRTQKIFRDVLGRTVKSQVLNYDGSAYSTTLTEYNVRDQATAVKEFKGDAAIGASCPLGNCQQTELVYDGHGRLQKRYLPIYQDNNVAPPYNGNSSARSANRQYYNDDMVNIETDPRGATATYTYNNRGLVTGVSYYSPNPSVIPNKPNVTFGYDELGNRLSMADGAGTITYNNNGLGQTMSESRVFTMSGAPSGTFTVNYDYTIGGQLKYVRDPFGDQINYDYDRAGRLISVTGATAFAGVTNYASGIQYRAWGALKANRTYDARLRPTSAYYYGTINYQYNQASDLTYAEMTTGSQYHQSFGYDQAARLTSVSTPEITVPNQYVMTQSNPPNGLPANYKIRPFTTSVSYDEFDNATSTTNNYWHDITPNLNYSQQFFQTTYVNGRVKKDGVAGKVYNNHDETWAYNTMGQVTADTRTVQSFDAAGQTTRTQDASNAQIYVNYGYDGDGLQAKFDQKRANGTTEVRYRIYSSVLGGLLTDISSTGQKVETRVYRFVYGQDSVRQVKAYSVPNGGNPPFNYPDVVVFEGSDPHRTRASVWDHDSNTNKTLSLAAPGAYVEDINWQGLKDRFVSNIGSQYSYGQQSASQYLSSYFSMVDPRNPGTGCSLDGVRTQCSEVFKNIKQGALGHLDVFSPLGVFNGPGFTVARTTDPEEDNLNKGYLNYVGDADQGGQQNNHLSDCGRFVDDLVKEGVGPYLFQADLGRHLALLARDTLAPQAKKGTLGFDGFQQKYIAGGQNGFALVHIAGVAGVTLVGHDKIMPFISNETGYDRANAQLKEDTDQLNIGLEAQRRGFTTTGQDGRIHGYSPNHPLQQYIDEKHAEREDDGAGTFVGHILEGVRNHDITADEARRQIFSRLCDR